MNQQAIPSFFIVGAPKCGTTAMYDYLLRHPLVFMPAKEVYFFGKDLTFREARPSLEYYLSLFENAPQNQLIGEASVWYLYSKTAAEEIFNFNPKAKIIIMLRRQSDMLYALHSQQLYSGNEVMEDFGEALKAAEKGRQSHQIPPFIGCPYEALDYWKVGEYREQLERYLAVFGREQIHFIAFDDFTKNTADVYTQTLDFLGLSTDFETSFEPVNSNKKIKWKGLRNFLKKRPQWLIRLAKILLPSRNLRQYIQSKLWAWNTDYQKRPPLNDDLRQRLENHFEADWEATKSLMKCES